MITVSDSFATDAIPPVYRHIGGPVLTELLLELDALIAAVSHEWENALNPTANDVAAQAFARTMGWGFLLDLGIEALRPEMLRSVGDVDHRCWKSSLQFWYEFLFDAKLSARITRSFTHDPSSVSVEIDNQEEPLTDHQTKVIRLLTPARYELILPSEGARNVD